MKFDKLVESVLTESKYHPSLDVMLKKSDKIKPASLVKFIEGRDWTAEEILRIDIEVNSGTEYLGDPSKIYKLNMNLMDKYDDTIQRFSEDFASPLDDRRTQVTKRIDKKVPYLERDEMLKSKEFKKYIASLKKEFPNVENVKLIASMWDEFEL